MKFKYLFAFPILAMALVGCDEIEMSDAKPVENPQLPGITMEDFSVTPAAALTGVMNLEALSAETDDPDNFMVDLYTINVLTENLPESAVLGGGLELADNPEFENYINVGNITVTEGVASAPLSSLTYVRSQMFGKDPRPYTVYYRVPVYVTVNGGQYKIGTKDSYFCDGDSFTQEGTDPGYVVEEAYYLVGSAGNTCATAVKFNHSQYNIYDDAAFTLTVKFPEGNTSWQVVPQSVYEAANGGVPEAAACYGPADAEALTGTLELGQTGTVEGGKKYDFTINLSTLEYTIKEVADFDYLYTPGDANSWNQEASQQLYTSDYVHYVGYAYLSGGFKFTSAPNWDGINFGAGAEEGELVTDGSAGNVTVETPGLYWCEVNIDALTYTLLPIEHISMIGGFNNWGGDVQLTPSADFLTWTGTLELTSDADGANQWKFRMNNDWGHNLGGPTADPTDFAPGTTIEGLAADGKNFATPVGTYTVTLNLAKLPYSATLDVATK